MAPTGLPAATKSRTNCTASASSRSASGLATPTRQDESVVFVDRRIGDGDVDVDVSALSRWLNAWAFPASGASSLAVAPASVTAFQGSVCSTCSMPSLATRKAMVYPLRSCAIGTQRSFLIDFTCGVPEAGSQKRGRPLRRLGGATPPSGEAAGAGAGAEGGRVTTDLHVESAGDGGPAVVFVHAGIADVRMWDREFAALADRHRVVRYDVRGFGRSPDPTRDYFDHDDLLAVLDDAGLDRAVLVGASNGGRIVLDAAITAPGRVQALVLVGSALPGVPLGADVEADFDAEGEALMAGDVDRAREINLRWWVDGVGRDPSAVDPSVRAMVTGWLDELLPRQAAQMAAARGDAQLVEPPVRDRLANIDVPALVLVGRHDAPGMDVIARHLAAGLPQAHLVEIEGAAHLPNLEQPDRFAGLLGRFLASLEV